MSEASSITAPAWQLPLSWLLVSLIGGCGLFIFYYRIPLPYRPLLRNARWIVIPYLGLLTGGVSPRLMGLTGINWFASFGVGLVLMGGILVLLVLVRSVTAFSGATLRPARMPGTQTRANPTARTAAAIPVSLLAIGAEEFHAAFLRSTLWEICLALPWLAPQAGYWAAWPALLLALPEAMRYQTTFAQRLCKGVLLLTTTVLFLFTRNFWLSWLLHILGWMLLAPSAIADAPGSEPTPQPSGPEPSRRRSR